jgi:hypothetical protein
MSGGEICLEDATWESEHILQHPGLRLLEDKQSQEGRTVMSLPFDPTGGGT